MRMLVLAVLLFASATVADRAAAPDVPYPEDYRRWAHVKSALIGPESPSHARFGGLHHVYANAAAVEGLASGRYADGAMFVFDLLEVRTENGVTVEGPRRHLDVMRRDAARYAATDGWGYQEFAGDGRAPALDAAAAGACHDCHAAQGGPTRVFSRWRD